MSRHIFYTSDSYMKLHSSNKNSLFRNSIEKIQLDYLPSGQIECTVINITFTLKELMEKGSYQLGLRSSLPTNETIRSNHYDNIIYTFTISASDKLTVNYPIPPTQYIYFNTNKEKLLSAKFEIVDLNTNQRFTLIDGSQESTVINIVVRKQEMNSFPILLESCDKESQQFYSANSNMNFTVCLPERQELQGETWGVTCKSLQTTAKIWNVQDSTFSIAYDQYWVTGTLNGVDRVHYPSVKSSNFTIPPGYYSNIRKILDLLNKYLNDSNIPCSLSINYRNHVKLIANLSFNQSLYLKERSSSTLTVSANLANLLGFSSSQDNIEFDFLTEKLWQAQYPVNMSFGVPGIIFVQCSILQSELVGHQHFPVLQMLSLKQNKSQANILHFVMRENHECLLKTKLFSEINIKVTNVYGVAVKAENDFATVIHLVFHRIQ